MNTVTKTIREGQVYLSPQQVAGVTGVGLRTVRKWIDRKYNPLPAAKVGHRRLIKRHVLEQWIDDQIPPPTSEEVNDLRSLIDNIFSEMKSKSTSRIASRGNL